MAAVSAINFSIWPGAQVRLPGVYAEIQPADNSGAVLQNSLLIGQMLSSGTATPNEPVIVTSVANAQALFGLGSMLALMTAAYLADDSFSSLYALPLSDASGASAATGSIAVTGPASAAGTISLYVAGVLTQTGVNSGDSASTIATNLAATINGLTSLPCTASVATSTVTVTAKNKGIACSDIQLVLNYGGAINNQVTPAGVGLTITAVTGGGADPDLATALANLGTQGFDYICCPYTESTQLGEVESLLSPTTGRWSWQFELFGLVFSSIRDQYSSLVTYGATNNSPYVSIMGFYDSPTPAYIWAADYCAAAAASLRASPALPLNTVSLNAVLAPRLTSRFTMAERNGLLFDGISTFTVDQANTVHIERSITTYTTSPSGAPDSSYLNVERLATLTAAVRSIIDDLKLKFGRAILVADGSNIPGGSSVVTAQIIAMEAVANYQSLANTGLVQNPAAFAQNIQWANVGNGQVQLLLPIVCSDQLENIALLCSFSA